MVIQSRFKISSLKEITKLLVKQCKDKSVHCGNFTLKFKIFNFSYDSQLGFKFNTYNVETI